MENPLILEQEISDIEERLAKKRAELEDQKQAGAIEPLPHEKETLHEIVGEKIQEKVPQLQPAVPPSSNTNIILPPPTASQPSYLSDELKDKVQELINIAFQENLDKAIGKAKDFNNPALLEAFHGALVDELFQYLVERGKLNKL